MDQNQPNPPNFFEQYSKHLMESNQHLNRIGNLLVGVLITTGIVALTIIIIISKISQFGGQ